MKFCNFFGKIIENQKYFILAVTLEFVDYFTVV